MLLTDGANTRGIEPVEAAKIAAERGVRVYPIGFGTRNPTTMVCTAAQLGGRDFDERRSRRGRGGGGRNFLVADEATLREVATITGGEYFAANDADRLQSVLDGPTAQCGDPAPRRRGERGAGGPGRGAAAAEPVGGGSLDRVPDLTGGSGLGPVSAPCPFNV